MVKAIFDFFQIHREMVVRDPSILIQNMFGVTPTSFSFIDMILGLSATHEAFGVVDRIMFPIPFQGLIAAKRIGVID